MGRFLVMLVTVMVAGGALAKEPMDVTAVPPFSAKLVDGSVLVCRPPKPFLVVKSAIVGQLTVPWSAVAVVTPHDNGHVVEVLLMNGDRVIGEPVPLRFKVSTDLGEVWILWEQIAEFSNPRVSLSAFIIHGKVKQGHVTTFVKGVPEVLAHELRRETKSIGTSGPATSRGGPGHWLYHTGDGAEVPWIFEEDGCRWYPIWGTWRLLLGGRWAAQDENNHGLDPTIPWESHWETRVDFFVIPLNPQTSETTP